MVSAFALHCSTRALQRCSLRTKTVDMDEPREIAFGSSYNVAGDNSAFKIIGVRVILVLKKLDAGEVST